MRSSITCRRQQWWKKFKVKIDVSEWTKASLPFKVCLSRSAARWVLMSVAVGRQRSPCFNYRLRFLVGGLFGWKSLNQTQIVPTSWKQTSLEGARVPEWKCLWCGTKNVDPIVLELDLHSFTFKKNEDCSYWETFGKDFAIFCVLTSGFWWDLKVKLPNCKVQTRKRDSSMTWEKEFKHL